MQKYVKNEKRYRLIHFICLLAVYKKLIGTGRVLGTRILRYVCSCLVCLCVGVTVVFKYKEDRYPFQSALLQIETFKHSYKIYVIKHFAQQMFIIWCL